MNDDVINPFTGELVDLNDIDCIAANIRQVNDEMKKAYAFKDRLKIAVAAMIPPHEDDRTVFRVRGNLFKIVIERPSVKWDARALAGLARQYPSYAADFIVPSQLNVPAAKLKRLQGETGTKEFIQFKEMLLAACKGRIGSPDIKVEDV